MKDQKKLNDFTRKYLLKSPVWNVITKVSGGKKHKQRVDRICLDLDYELSTPFATEPEFKTGYKPDIICPLHIKPIIEVRCTETIAQTKAKEVRIPTELLGEIIYNETSILYEMKQIQ